MDVIRLFIRIDEGNSIESPEIFLGEPFWSEIQAKNF